MAAHARSDRSVLTALDTDVDLIYHCVLAGEATIDLLEAAKDRIFLAPALGPSYVRHKEISLPKPAAG